MNPGASTENMIIALDAMGGDSAPGCVIEGASFALSRYPEVRFVIYGNEEKIRNKLKKYPSLADVSKIIHTDDFVSNEEKPSVALRQKRNSSMGLAIKAVRNGEVAAVVSSGNTGALMALAKIILRTLPGIDRPAIGTVLPTSKGECVMLDLGANVVCDANNLFEFAVMGDAFARSILDLESPSIGLLNIGTEEMKGNDVVKTASNMLKECDLNLNFYGHIEGDDIGRGVVDVVVTDGFSGNIALKMAEGTAKMIYSYLSQCVNKSWLAKFGMVLALPALKKVKKKFDPRMHNGAMLLGLNGIVIKSHGGTDALGFSNAVGVAIKLVRHGINECIIKEMVQSGHIPAEAEKAEDLSVRGKI